MGTDNYTRIYEDGSVIFLEGESGDRAYVVEEGEVEIWCHRDNERVLLQELKPGAIFGEMSELVLSSQKVKSNRLNDYVFKFSEINDAIRDLSN